MKKYYPRMKRVIAAILVSTAALLHAQGQTGTPFRIEKIDPALDAIHRRNAQLEMLGDRFALTEGPVWMPDPAGGYLLFSDNAANVIYKWQQGQPLSVFLERSGYTGRDVSTVGAQTVAGRVPILLIGSNGLALDPQRRVVVTAMNDRTVFRLEKDGTRTILADRYEGKRFNGPNDLVVKSNGSVYFTDTVWGLRGADKDPAREIPYSGTFLIKNGTVTLLLSDKDTPGRVWQRHHALARRENSLCHCGHARNDAVRRAARRHHRQWTAVRGPRRGRHENRRARESVYDQRGHAGHPPDHIARREAAGASSLAATWIRAAAARMCHQRSLRRRGLSQSLHHRLHPPVQDSDESRRITKADVNVGLYQLPTTDYQLPTTNYQLI
jgi:hypothetical protein